MISYSESGIYMYNTDVTLNLVRMLSGMRLIDYCVYYKLRLDIFLHSIHGRSLGWNFTEGRGLVINFCFELLIVVITLILQISHK